MYEVSEKRRIVVAEDDLAIQQVLCFFLRHNGFEVRGASNGQEAIRIIREFNPHLVVLDLVMRPVSGWDVLQWLRVNRLTPPIAVLVLSALVQMREQVLGFEEGAVEYITKPAQPSVVVERVRTILSLNMEQRLMLQHNRLDERRRVMERMQDIQPDDFSY
ncbi:MAG TPA: response regulator [Ktedonobacteraceae bacterium]|jgi:DNA-binding response OmpR family regulator|nr:response regulator [Ktedonobacteraceae bacterium]